MQPKFLQPHLNNKPTSISELMGWILVVCLFLLLVQVFGSFLSPSSPQQLIYLIYIPVLILIAVVHLHKDIKMTSYQLQILSFLFANISTNKLENTHKILNSNEIIRYQYHPLHCTSTVF